jgi:hypothetical protein
MREIRKRPTEQFPIYLPFAGRLPPGAVLVSATAVVIDETDDSDVTATLLNSATGTIVEGQVVLFLQAGTLGHPCHLAVQALLTPGAPVPLLEEDLRIVIEIPVPRLEVEKQPSERYSLALSFLGRLPPGTALGSATVVALNEADDTDVTATLLDSPTALIVDGQAHLFVNASAAGSYLATVSASLVPGTPVPLLEESIRIVVTEI